MNEWHLRVYLLWLLCNYMLIYTHHRETVDSYHMCRLMRPVTASAAVVAFVAYMSTAMAMNIVFNGSVLFQWSCSFGPLTIITVTDYLL